MKLFMKIDCAIVMIVTEGVDVDLEVVDSSNSVSLLLMLDAFYVTK